MTIAAVSNKPLSDVREKKQTWDYAQVPLKRLSQGSIRINKKSVIRFAIANYRMHKAFPEIFSPEPTFRGLNHIYGCHPPSNIAFVSGVGTHSKRVAYGMNRVDYSFVAGIVPGVLILPPDFPGKQGGLAISVG